MSQQHVDPRETNHEERNHTQAEYRDVPYHYNHAPSLSGQKIYPVPALSSNGQLILTIISLVLWLFAMFIVLIIFLAIPTTTVLRSSNPAQPPIIENVSGSNTLFIIAIVVFLLFSISLFVINVLVRRRS